MPNPKYSDPVARLLTAGDPRDWKTWPDYPQVYGLTLADVPELIRMAGDEISFELDAGEDLSVWRNVHAWRALGQLRAEDAAEPLVGLLRWVDEHDDDWSSDDLPRAIAMLGSASLELMSGFLADPTHGLYSRAAAINGLTWLVEEFPAGRDDCITVFLFVLEDFAENDPELNAYLIDGLVELEAVAAAPLVEQAFIAGRVAEEVRGDWEDFQVDMGLLEERLTPPEYGWLPMESDPLDEADKEILRKQRLEEKKAKEKRKQEKKSRKQNRKKKK